MTKITYLSFEIRGDCSQAISALSSVEDAADHLAGRDFPFSVSPEGVDNAVREVHRVSDAIAASSGMMSIGADTGGLDDAHSAVASLRGGIADLSQDLSGLSGMSVGVDGAGAIRGLSDEMSGLGSVLGATASGLNDFNTAGSTFGRTSSDFSRSGAAMRQEIEGITGATNDLTASTRELVSVQSDGAQVMDSVRSGGTPGGSFGGSGGGFFGGSGGFDNSPGGSDGPPPHPPGGRGGAGDDGSGFGDGLGSLGGPLMMGGAVGAVEGLLPGMGGLLAVKEAVKDVPMLAAASKVAMLDFKEGIYQAAQGATGVGVPALLALGQTLHGLGGEVGHMAAEHMSTALSGVNTVAAQATETLKALDPAVESSMNAVFGLADAFQTGLSNPATVTSIKTIADAMGDVSNDKGFGDLVSSLGTVAATVATPLANALGTAGNLLGLFGAQGEGPAASAGLGGFLGSKALSRDAAAAAKSGKPEIGKFAAGLTGAGIFAQAAEDQQSGVDPTAGMVGGGGGALLAKALGMGGPGMMAMAAGGELLMHDGAVVGGGDPSGRTSTAPGGAFAAPAPAPGSRSGTPFSPDTGGIHDKGGGWRDETLLGQALDALGVSRSLSGPTGPRPDWQKDSALAQEADKEFAAGQDPVANMFGGGPKGPDPASPEGIQAKAAQAQKASAADPTNLGLYQEAAFAKAVAEARKKSKNNDDPMAAFMASGPGGGGGSAPMVGTQGGGSWTTSGGMGGGGGGGVGAPIVGSSGAGGWTASSGGAAFGGGGSLSPVIPKGPGSSGALMSGSDMAGLGIGPTSGTAGVRGNIPGDAGTPGQPGERFTLGGGDPHPTGGISMDGRPTLTSGWGPGGVFQPGGTGGGQILSSLTDLRSTASNMFGAMGGLPGGGPEAAALRRDWAATGDVPGGASSDNVAGASRYLGSDIQRASQSVFDGGQASIDAYTNRLADQSGLQRAPATGVSSGAVGGQSLPGTGPALYPGIGANADNNAPMSNLGQQLSALGGRPGVPGEVTGAKTGPTSAGIMADYSAQPHSVGDLRFGGPSITSEGLPPGWGTPRGYAPPPGFNTPPGDYKGPTGPGSSGPAGAGQLEHLNQALTSTDARMAQSTQTNHAMAQSLQQISKGGEQAQQSARPMEQMNSSMQGISSGANQAAQSVGGLGDSLKGANAAAGGAGGGGGGLGAAMAGGMDTGLAGFAASVGTGASAAGRTAGEATASAMASGMAQASAKVGNEAGAMGSIAANSASMALKVHSPSKVFTDIGQATGDGMALGIANSMPAVGSAMGGAIHGITDAARGVASDSGLMVGYSFVESILTGEEQAIKSSQFQQLGFADIKDAKVKAALGALGLLGPAGSGAQSYQLSAQEVSFAKGTAANAATAPPPQQVTVNVALDGKPFDAKIATMIGTAFGHFTDQFERQRSG